MTYLTTLNTLCGYVALMAIQQSPYVCPDNLELVLRKFAENAQELASFVDGGMVFFRFHQPKGIELVLRQALLSIPEAEAWNEPKSGHGEQNIFVGRHSPQVSPDDDFIDLDALVRNISQSVTAAEKEKEAA